MFIGFDKYNKYEKPTIILALPSKSYIGALGNAYGLRVELCFNDLSVIEFSVPQQVNGVPTAHYDSINGKKLIYLENIGWFKLENPRISHDGIVEIKQCTAYSLETELRQKNITAISGTFRFYNPVSPLESLLGIIAQEIPSWSIGNVDASLQGIYRTFDIDEANLYGFMMEDVAKAYDCVFTFDTTNKKINAYALTSIGTDTSIFLSFDNLLKTIEIEENSEEIVTALKVYGGNGLSIRSVNPNGSDTIYDFSYFKNTGWMSSGLIAALNSYEALVASLNTTYINNLSTLKTKHSQLLDLQTELRDLEGELNALEDIQRARIQAGLDYDDIYSQIEIKEAEIKTKENQIDDKTAEIEAISAVLSSINNQLKWTNNFTAAQIKELDTFIIEDTFQDNSFITTDLMSEQQKVEAAQELLDYGATILHRVSQPRYTFNVSSANFIFLKEFANFTGQLALGSFVNLAIREDYVVKPILLKIAYNFENDTEFELTFGNKYKLDGEFLLEDLLKSAVASGTKLSFEQFSYGDWSNNKDEVTSFINSALDASKNAVVSSETQDVLINNTGIRLRQSDGQNGYLPEQLWIVNNMIALSNNGFQTAEIGIGKIFDDNLGERWGIAAPLLVGTMIAGNSLLITNQNNKFRVDATGATLTDATFTLNTSNGKNRIIISPTDGIKIQASVGGTFVNKFYVDSAGNVVFAGNLSGANGTFSGNLSAAGGTFTGTLSGVDGTFSGTISASTIKTSNLVSPTMTAAEINGGVITGTTINGATINGGAINVLEDMYVGDRIYFQDNGQLDKGLFWEGGGKVFYDQGAQSLNLYAPGGVNITGFNATAKFA